MSRERHPPEEIVSKLRQVEVLVAQGTPVVDAIRSIGVTEVDCDRKLPTALQHGPVPCLPGLQTSRSGGAYARLCCRAGYLIPTGSGGPEPRRTYTRPTMS